MSDELEVMTAERDAALLEVERAHAAGRAEALAPVAALADEAERWSGRYGVQGNTFLPSTVWSTITGRSITVAELRAVIADPDAVASISAAIWDEGYNAGDPYHRRGDPAWSDNPYRTTEPTS